MAADRTRVAFLPAREGEENCLLQSNAIALHPGYFGFQGGQVRIVPELLLRHGKFPPARVSHEQRNK
jgi:hypothetical protein